MDTNSLASSVSDKDLIAGLAKGLHLIEAFDDTHARLTSSEAARLVGISPAAARRCLLTLCLFIGTNSLGFNFILPTIQVCPCSCSIVHSASHVLHNSYKPQQDYHFYIYQA